MTTLHDLFDVPTFNRLVADGYIRVQTHPEHQNYSIANYAEKTQFDRKWVPETVASRGLIYNSDTLEVISRGFPKFWSWDDSTQPLPPHGAMLKSNKFDGSLGISYLAPDDSVHIATRGSFASDQAKNAERILASRSDDEIDEIQDLLFGGFTPLFEIIYPENRIVVDYGTEERLVLLDVIENATGRSALDLFDSMYWLDKAEKTLVAGGFYDTIASDIADDEEGFVLYWPSTGFRCKVKGAYYVHLHGLLTNTSNRDIWRHMAVNDCKSVVTSNKDWSRLGIDSLKAQAILAMGDDWEDVFLRDVPDEFYGWVRRTIADINASVKQTVQTVRTQAHDLTSVSEGRERYEASQEYEKHGSASLNYANTLNYTNLLTYAWKVNFPSTYEKPFSDKVDG